MKFDNPANHVNNPSKVNKPELKNPFGGKKEKKNNPYDRFRKKTRINLFQ